MAKLVSPVWAIRRSGFVNWLSAKGSILQVLIIAGLLYAVVYAYSWGVWLFRGIPLPTFVVGLVAWQAVRVRGPLRAGERFWLSVTGLVTAFFVVGAALTPILRWVLFAPALAWVIYSGRASARKVSGVAQ